jgi:hypothetical protein
MDMYTSVLIFFEQTDFSHRVMTTIVNTDQLNFLNRINRRYRGVELTPTEEEEFDNFFYSDSDKQVFHSRFIKLSDNDVINYVERFFITGNIC